MTRKPKDERQMAPPASYFLSAHAYLCEFEDGAIVLDLRSGNYLGIDAEHVAHLRPRIANWPGSGSDATCENPPTTMSTDQLIGDLLRREILTSCATTRRHARIQQCLSAFVIAVGQISSPITLRHALQFSIAFLIVQLRYKHGLHPLLEWLRRRQCAIHRDSGAATMTSVRRRLAAFMGLRIWCYTASRRCLFDSLVLSVYMTREMVPCTFVIGVSTKPFLAHSWVQVGQLVLNDTAEHIQEFKPILAIGECEH